MDEMNGIHRCSTMHVPYLVSSAYGIQMVHGIDAPMGHNYFGERRCEGGVPEQVHLGPWTGIGRVLILLLVFVTAKEMSHAWSPIELTPPYSLSMHGMELIGPLASCPLFGGTFLL